MDRQHQEDKPLTLQLFLTFLKKRGASSKTLNGYTSDLRTFFTHMNLNTTNLDASALGAIRAEDIENYVRALATQNLRLSTVRRRVAAVRSYFRFISDQGIIPSNPAEPVTVRPLREDALSSEQILSVFSYLTDRQESYDRWEVARYQRDELMLLLMVFYGVRQYQMPALKLSSIKHTGKQLTLTIGRNDVLKLDGLILQKLRAYLDARKSNADPLFLEMSRNKPVGYGSLRALFTELSRALHIACTPRSLHATYLSLQQNPDGRRKLLSSISTKGPSHAL